MWRWRSNSLTVRLTGTLIVALGVLLLLVAVIQIGLQDRYASSSASLNGLAMTETLFGALHSSMLANDRAGLHRTVSSIAERSPNVRVRIFNKEGEIVFSSEKREIGQRLDPRSEACFMCHQADRPIEKLPPGDRTRHFNLSGSPALGVIKPIENEPSCSTASCHAHEPSKRLLGVLDVVLVMSQVDSARRQTFLLMATTAGVALLLVAGVVITVVRRAVHRPIRALTTTLEALGNGDLTARYERSDISEFKHLGDSVNQMAHDLERANLELVGWAQTLERRVEEKTAELRHAQEQMIRVERMASLGKLAAVVAHEINNPLASVVTYSKLLLRRLAQRAGEDGQAGENRQILGAIASESARCGEIVSNLLLFARRTGSHLEPTNLNDIIRRGLFLIKHKMDLNQVKLQEDLAPELPPMLVDPAQIEQAMLALFINAIEAMPSGGTLSVGTSETPEGGVRMVIADTGIGMDDEVRAHIFEPFFTTKGDRDGKGLGLGLAVVFGIVERHGGSIEVESAPDQGSTFTFTIPPGGAKEA